MLQSPSPWPRPHPLCYTLRVHAQKLPEPLCYTMIYIDVKTCTYCWHWSLILCFYIVDYAFDTVFIKKSCLLACLFNNMCDCYKVSNEMTSYKHRASFRTTLFLVHVTVASGGTTRQHNVIGWPTSTDSDWLYVVGWPSFITTAPSSCSNCATSLTSSCCNERITFTYYITQSTADTITLE